MATGSHKGAPFSWADPFLFEDQLTEEERMIRDSAAAVAPPGGDLKRVRDLRFKDPGFDRGTLKQMGEMGWIGLRVPEERGGAGLGAGGALIQGHTRNPIADTGLLGINAGASFAVVLAIFLLGWTSPAQYIWLAFLGAALAGVGA